MHSIQLIATTLLVAFTATSQASTLTHKLSNSTWPKITYKPVFKSTGWLYYYDGN